MIRRLNQRGNHALIALVTILVLGGLGASGYAVSQRLKNTAGEKADTGSTNASLEIKTFDDCKKAEGSVVMESFPERCKTADGREFTADVDAESDPASYLTIKEWKVRIKTGDLGAYYKIDVESPDSLTVYATAADEITGPAGKSCKGEYIAYLKKLPAGDPYWTENPESGLFATRRTLGDTMYAVATKKQYGPECFDDGKSADYATDMTTVTKFQDVVDDFKADFMSIESY